ncbi:hypothetical protein M5D96_010028, partial [Drosophila gunungcola]
QKSKQNKTTAQRQKYLIVINLLFVPRNAAQHPAKRVQDASRSRVARDGFVLGCGLGLGFGFGLGAVPAEREAAAEGLLLATGC